MRSFTHPRAILSQSLAEKTANAMNGRASWKLHIVVSLGLDVATAVGGDVVILYPGDATAYLLYIAPKRIFDRTDIGAES